jgi:hypothetical protein
LRQAKRDLLKIKNSGIIAAPAADFPAKIQNSNQIKWRD